MGLIFFLNGLFMSSIITLTSIGPGVKVAVTVCGPTCKTVFSQQQQSAGKGMHGLLITQMAPFSRKPTKPNLYKTKMRLGVIASPTRLEKIRKSLKSKKVNNKQIIGLPGTRCDQKSGAIMYIASTLLLLTARQSPF